MRILIRQQMGVRQDPGRASAPPARFAGASPGRIVQAVLGGIEVTVGAKRRSVPARAHFHVTPYGTRKLLGRFMVRAAGSKPSLLGHFAALLGIFLAHQGILLRVQTESFEVFFGQQLVSLADVGL